MVQVTLLAAQQNDLIWTQLPHFNMSPRAGHASILFSNYIITFGGYDDVYFNDIVAYDIPNQKWSTVKPTGAIPTARSRHTMCLVPENKVIVFGGKKAMSELMNEIGMMTININENGLNIEWKVINNDPLTLPHRSGHIAHVYQNKMYIFGGIDDSGDDIMNFPENNEVWCMNTEDFTWNPCETHGHAPGKLFRLTFLNLLDERTDHTSAIYKHNIYVFGGWYRIYRYFSDIHMLDLSNRFRNSLISIKKVKLKWEKIVPTGSIPTPRRGASAQELDGIIYFFGGDNGTENGQLFTFSIDTNNWEEIKEVSEGEYPSPRVFHTSVISKNNLYILGGANYPDYYSDFYSLRLKHYFTRLIEEEPPKQEEKTLKPDIGNSVLKELFLNQEFSDIFLKVGDKEFPAHKVVLARRCKYFRNLFLSEMSEANSKIISIPDIKLEVFEAMLSFIYGHEVKIVDEDLVFALLEVSDKFLMSDLKKETEEFISGILKADNFVKTARFSESIGCDYLREAVLDYAEKNAGSLKGREDLFTLPNTILVQMFERIAPN